MLIGLDTNIVDLIEEACASPHDVDAMEAMESPPRFRKMPREQVVEVLACYWLLALAASWRSTVYTCSDELYEEVAEARGTGPLLRIALNVLVREWQEKQYRQPDPDPRPTEAIVKSLGVKGVDATHIADAVGLGCDYLLTNDRQLRNKSNRLEERWGLRLRRPSEFLVEAVRDGAPWTTRASWPWISMEWILDRRQARATALISGFRMPDQRLDRVTPRRDNRDDANDVERK